MDVAAVKGGRILDSRRLPVELPSEPNAWAKAVRRSGQNLRAAVQELGLTGSTAVLLYRSPTQAVDLASFPLRSTGQACAAAALTCTEALPYPVTSAICQTVAVGRDQSGSERKTHVVVAAERSDIVRALVEMVEAAGLAYGSATPIDAAIMAGLIGRALRHAGPQHGWLHFGTHSSFFILAGGGAVRFERSISLGLKTIAKSLTRPIRVQGADEPFELDPETADKILHRHGIPEDDEQIIHEERKLTRRHIMPLMQPVLQRYIVELRQSLRFGISEEKERESIAITVTGPGSALPGFAELIAWELRLDVSSDPHYAAYDYLAPAASGSELTEAIDDQQFLSRLNIQPQEMAQRRRFDRLRRWLWAGAAAALAMLGADAYRIHLRIADAKREAATLATATSVLETLQETQTRLLTAIGAMEGLEKTVADELGDRVSLRAVLQEFSRLTPESVRLTSMQFRRVEGKMTGRISGRASPIPGAGTQTELEPFVEALKNSPLIENVVLRNVQVSSLGPTSGQRFDAAFDAVETPETSELDAVATGDGGTEE
jgi:Tfp pilus assembly protein PilN